MSAAGSYQLGVDLGTTYTAAAVARDGVCKMVGLGNRAAAIPSVVHVAADGSIRIGEAADRRGPTEPGRVAREYKRRVGDPTPLLLGGTPYSAEALLGTVLDAVVARVSELEGGPPSHLTVTHPANWGPYKQELFDHCVRVAGVASASTVTEPEAAAISYAANERVEPGSLVAVYDLGGGTFDVAVLRKTADGFSILGRPEGIERLGGIDFDEAVIGHVREALRGALDQLDVNDPAVLAALARLRRDCTEAKEALSSDSEALVPVLLPGVQTDVRLTRPEFERMIRPTLDSTIAAMRRALVAAAVEPQQISAVLLVGGSSRIPLVAELVSRAFERPVAVDAHPKHAVALGAAQAATLAVGDVEQSRGDARVLEFVTPDAGAREPRAAAVAGPTSPSPAAAVAGPTSPSPAAAVAGPRSPSPAAADPSRTARAANGTPRSGAGAVADARPSDGTTAARPATVQPSARPRRQWDRRPYDDEPTEVPLWLAGARGGRPSRRRLWTGIIAFLMLSALTIGAGAFLTADPRSEAHGVTPVVNGSPASERPGDTAGDQAAAPGDAEGADTELSEAGGAAALAPPATGASARGDGDGDGDVDAKADGARRAGDDRPTGAPSTGADDRDATPDDEAPADGGDPTPEPDPADPPADPDPGSEQPTEFPSEPAGGGSGPDDQQTNAAPGRTDAPILPTRSRS